MVEVDPPEVNFEYQIRMRKSSVKRQFVTGKTMYEILGAFKVRNQDIKNWVEGQDKV